MSARRRLSVFSATLRKRSIEVNFYTWDDKKTLHFNFIFEYQDSASFEYHVILLFRVENERVKSQNEPH